MSFSETIRVEGIVVKAMSDSVGQVELPNKHVVVGHLSRKSRLHFTGLSVGERVVLIISPYDLSRGTIVGKS